MTWLLGLLGFGGVATAVANSFTAVVQSIAPVAGVVLQAIAQFIIWYCKEFWSGLQTILSNLSTLTVIVLLMAGSGYYFRTWDNPKVLKECNEKIVKLEKQVPKKPAPKPQTQTYQPWNPFEWLLGR